MNPSGDEPTQKTIGNYRLIRQLGQGGMGVVFEAVHQQIGRRAAVKMLHPEYAVRPEFQSRFFNEACANNVIQHPGIVSVIEYGTADNGCPFIVMEYLDGEQLSARIRRVGKMGESGLHLIRQLASALAAAHDKGIIHRDVKPDNIMLVPDPEMPGGERVKVLDFGIAKLAEDYAGPRSGGLTATGAAIGTAVYMSPEQCRSASRVDGRCDVYAVGVILYEILTGRPPFIGDGPGHLMGMHIYEQPVPVRKREPSVSQAVADLVDRMLIKDPQERPHMREVIAALEHLGAAAPSGALPLTTLRPTSGIRGPTTTLGKSAVEIQHPKKRTLIHGVLAIAGALTILGGVIAIRPYLRPAKVVPLKWTIETTPPGALVIRAADGAALGQTPLIREHAPEAGLLKVTLRLENHVSSELSLPLDQSGEYRVNLSKIPPPKEPAPAAAPPMPAPPQQAAPAKAQTTSARVSRSAGKPARPANQAQQTPGKDTEPDDLSKIPDVIDLRKKKQ